MKRGNLGLSLIYIRCMLLWIILNAALSGCSFFANPHKEYKDYCDKLFLTLDGQVRSQELLPKVSGVIQFSEACLRAVSNNPNVIFKINEMKNKKLDVTGADTLVWPRLSLRATSSLAISDNDDERNKSSGGLYFDYDIWRAVFSRYEVDFHKAEMQLIIKSVELEVESVIKLVYLKAAEIKAWERQVDTCRQLLELAETGLYQVRELSDAAHVDMSSQWKWEAIVQEHKAKLWESKSRLKEARRALAKVIGVFTDEVTGVADLPEILSGEAYNYQQALLPSEVWKRRHEALIAEAELMHAEFSIQKSWWKRLPRINAAFGVGDVQSSFSNDVFPFVAELTIDLPLWDWGDSRRETEKAVNTRDMARKKIEKLSVNLWLESQHAHEQLDETREGYNIAVGRLAAVQEKVRFGEIMLEERIIDPMRLIELKSNFGKAEINREKAALKLQQAIVFNLRSRGEPLVHGLKRDILNTLLDSNSPYASN